MNFGIGNVKGKSGGVGFPVIEISLAQIDDDNVNFTEEQFNQIMACGNFTLKLPDGTFYNFVGFNNSLQASVFFYAIQDNQTTTPTELTITQLSIVKSTYVGTISPNTYTNGGGGGQQLYQHNIEVRGTDGFTSASAFLQFTIISSSDKPFVKPTDYVAGTNQNIMAYFNDYGINKINDGTARSMLAVGWSFGGDEYRGVYRYYDGGTEFFGTLKKSQNSYGSLVKIVNTTVIDVVSNV